MMLRKHLVDSIGGTWSCKMDSYWKEKTNRDVPRDGIKNWNGCTLSRFCIGQENRIFGSALAKFW